MIQTRINNRTIRGMLLIVFMMALMMAVLTGCGRQNNADSNSSNANNSSDKIKVITTLFAPYDFAKNVAGDKADVKLLLAPGEESHSYDPTPQDIIAIEKCDLFIYNGGENETWVDDVLSQAKETNPDIKVIKMMDTVKDVYIEEAVEGMQSEHVDEHTEDELEYDEHVWTSLDNAVTIVNTITDTFTGIDSANADYYKENSVNYVGELTAVRDEIKAVVDSGIRKTIVLGDRFPMRYFVEEFGLDYYAAFPGCSADTEANAATIKFLIDTVKENSIPVVFKMELSSGNIADTIAGETGAKVDTLYACHNISKDDYEANVSYLDLMKRNLAVLKEALN